MRNEGQEWWTSEAKRIKIPEMRQGKEVGAAFEKRTISVVEREEERQRPIKNTKWWKSLQGETREEKQFIKIIFQICSYRLPKVIELIV